MSASPYTWEQWQERFIEALSELAKPQPDMAFWKDHWLGGADPIFCAEVYAETIQHIEE